MLLQKEAVSQWCQGGGRSGRGRFIFIFHAEVHNKYSLMCQEHNICSVTLRQRKEAEALFPNAATSKAPWGCTKPTWMFFIVDSSNRTRQLQCKLAEAEDYKPRKGNKMCPPPLHNPLRQLLLICSHSFPRPHQLPEAREAITLWNKDHAPLHRRRGEATLLCDVLWQQWWWVDENRHKWVGGETKRSLCRKLRDTFCSVKD